MKKVNTVQQRRTKAKVKKCKWCLKDIFFLYNFFLIHFINFKQYIRDTRKKKSSIFHE